MKLYGRVGLLFAYLSASLLVVAQAAPTAPPPKATGVLNSSSFNIQGVSPSATGLSVSIEGQNVAVLNASLEKQDPQTGNYLTVLSSVGIADVPSEISKSAEGIGIAKFPILVDPDPNTSYRLWLWAKSADSGEMDWGNAQSRVFRGYPPAAPATPPTFKLEFGSDQLSVSTATDDIRTLKAQWQVGSDTVATESTTNKNPVVGLKLAALQSGPGNQLPSLILSLEDPKTHQTQEARITLGGG